jgi:predicted Fe-S protein YdhL (DUF1289 family)
MLAQLAEIAEWYEASTAEQRAILARLDKRRMPSAAGANGRNS